MEEQLINALKELSSASKLINDAISLRETMHRYNMLFVGEKCNVIYTAELHHTMSEYFNVEMTYQELNTLIPEVCSALNMKYDPMVALEDINNPLPDQHRIELW